MAKQEDSKGARRDSTEDAVNEGWRWWWWWANGGAVVEEAKPEREEGRKGAISWLTGRENVKCGGISRQPCTSFFETDGGEKRREGESRRKV